MSSRDLVRRFEEQVELLLPLSGLRCLRVAYQLLYSADANVSVLKVRVRLVLVLAVRVRAGRHASVFGSYIHDILLVVWWCGGRGGIGSWPVHVRVHEIGCWDVEL